MNDLHTVTMVALGLGIASFLTYLVEVVVALRSPAADPKAVTANAMLALDAVPTVDQATKLLDAISKLTDSLAKAGPALTSLIAAVLFLFVAAFSAGAFKSPPTTPKDGQQQTTADHSQSQDHPKKK